jgi:hypothetical protein|tara:strand:- start:227 stop:574 length:348 start_codon:yes stop_codon:yes gene_type:complete
MALKYTVNKVNFIEPPSDEYPRYISLFGESLFTGLATLVIGKIALDLFDCKNPFSFSKKIGNNLTKEKKLERYKLCLAFFVSGFLIHMIIELIGLNCYFCGKQCLKNVSNFAKTI